MSQAQVGPMRVLLVDPDAAWRAGVRRSLPDGAAVAEVDDLVEGFLWLEGRPPGLALVAGDGPAAAEELARLRERHPRERVVAVVSEVSVPILRVALRAGAFDVLARHACEQGALVEVLDAASRRGLRERRMAQATRDERRTAVRRHEQSIARRLAERHPPPEGWGALPVDLRTRWLERYRVILGRRDPLESGVDVQALGREVAAHPGAAELALALHLHAVAWTRREDHRLDGAQAALIDLLLATSAAAEVAPRRRAGVGPTEGREERG